MPDCPHCRSPLKTVRQREGLFHHCPVCDGRAVTISQIRRVAGDRHATALLRQISRTFQFTNLPCPFCRAPMRVFQSEAPALELDACKSCSVVWFDPQEFEAMPEGVNESLNEVHLRTAEAIGLHRIETMKQDGLTHDEPDADWKTVPAFFGFPVESETGPLSRHPWFTWSLSAIIAAVSIWAFFNLTHVIEHFGLIPAQVTRLGGATLLTSFFLHGGIMHLVGNLYFLLVFGDNVEDFLGRWRYALLLLAATVTGDLLHVLVESKSTVPCVGASGGIAGIIVFYALQFPRARLGFLLRFYWHFEWMQIPAWVALIFWLLMQSVGVFLQLGGFSNVAATAHLGGAAAGFVFWLWRRKKENGVAMTAA